MINTLLATPGLDPAIRGQLQELIGIWDRIQELTDLRETKLAEALQLVSELASGLETLTLE
jgi:hypothetical protein